MSHGIVITPDGRYVVDNLFGTIKPDSRRLSTLVGENGEVSVTIQFVARPTPALIDGGADGVRKIVADLLKEIA